MQKTGWTKGFHIYVCDHWGLVINHFLCIRPISAWWRQTTNWTTKLVILEQACSWPVKRQSFAIFGHLATAQRTRLADKGWPCGKEDRSFWCCQGIFSLIPLMFCLAARKWLCKYIYLGFRKRFWSFSAQIIYGIDINNLLGWIIRSLEQEIRQTCLINARMFHEIRTRLDQTNLLVFSSNWVLVLK